MPRRLAKDGRGWTADREPQTGFFIAVFCRAVPVPRTGLEPEIRPQLRF